MLEAVVMQLYGGLMGTVSDILVMALKNAGSSIFAASFIVKIGNNLIDKVSTCILAFFLIKSLPVSMKSSLEGSN
jgi:energy-coupling factor transport system substrate-specific component